MGIHALNLRVEDARVLKHGLIGLCRRENSKTRDDAATAIQKRGFAVDLVEAYEFLKELSQADIPLSSTDKSGNVKYLITDTVFGDRNIIEGYKFRVEYKHPINTKQTLP